MAARHDWEALYQRFDPELPAIDTSIRAARPHSPVPELVNRLSAPFEDPRILVLGTIGTGKTTELLRLAEQRADEEFVVFLDLVNHFGEVVGDVEALQRISSWEVVFLSVLGLVRAAEEHLGHSWSPARLEALARAWHRASGAAESSIAAPAQFDPVKLASTMVLYASGALDGGVSAGLTMLGKAVEAGKWRLPIGTTRHKLPDQHEDLQNLLNTTNDLIGDFQQQNARRVLFIIDGLDRIRDQAHVRALLLDSDLIARLSCPVVACGPIGLLHSMAGVDVRRFEVTRVFNEPVLDHSNPLEPGPGLEFFRDVYAHRTSDALAGLISPEGIDRLAYYSGGRGRDFVRLIRMVARHAWRVEASVATPELIDRALDEARQIMETGLHRGHLTVLQSVIDDPQHRLPDDERVWELLSFQRLLPYPNESEWFYPHPLLTLRQLRVKC